MVKFRKMLTEKEMIEQLRSDKISLPPLSFRFLESWLKEKGNRRFDALVEASWQGNIAKFAVECKALSTPKAFQEGINLLKSLTLPNDYRPMLFLPFLSENQLQELEREEISGIDLCGNGVVVVPGIFAVFRSGGKNRFPSSAPIKNIYRKNSSMVGRVFFVNPVFNAVQEVGSEINQRNMLVNRWDKRPMSLSTVSKALRTLEQDLIVERRGTIRLLQPEKLLEKLRESYATPNITERLRLKVSESSEKIRELLLKLSQTLDLPLVATGISSVGRYAVMQRGDVLSVYSPLLEKLLKQLPGNQTDRFPNLELIETEDETVYFDARQEGDFWWASPVQVYLELMTGDKRDRETAEQVKSFLLKGIEQTLQ
ncbi:MAG: hypothetical protein DRH43_05920 [Deltaproteobacteria bacterium]|nr:MAG: hypothetical protein DRH43_05920 [Deltaproteobacteria bacterium]